MPVLRTSSSYQWQLANTNLPSATNRTLSFTAQAETAGGYRVVVSNPFASVTSRVATVVVDAKPSITGQPVVSQRIREGDSFTNQVGIFSCGALNYLWQFRPLNTTNFSPVSLDTSHFLATNGSLVVLNAQTNESDYYRLTVSNIYAGATSSVAFVRVVRPPPNDHFVNAFSLGSTNPVTVIGYNEFATNEIGELAHALQPPRHSVWWRWTNPFPSLVTVDLGGSDIDTLLSVYTGSSLSNLTILAEDDDGRPDKRSRVSFLAGGGRDLYLAVDGKNQAEGTNLVVSLTATPITSPLSSPRNQSAWRPPLGRLSPSRPVPGAVPIWSFSGSAKARPEPASRPTTLR